MDFFYIFFIAVALGADAFSVAIGVGTYLKVTTGRQRFRLSFHFGLFQFLMPIIGWLAGTTVEKYISFIDHWIDRKSVV